MVVFWNMEAVDRVSVFLNMCRWDGMGCIWAG